LKFAQTLDFFGIMIYNNCEVIIMQQTQLKQITDTITESAKELLGDKLHSIILYGSYARGDFNEDSDVDIMILADIDDSEIWKIRNKMCEVTSDLALELDVLVSARIKSRQIFEKWVDTLPYYKNVRKDGVMLYA